MNLRTPITLCLTLLAPALLHAQTTPTVHVYSRETLVDILATDKDGHPIHNLQSSDFTITEDGKPQSIRSFSEHSKDATEQQPHILPAKLPPNVYTNLQPTTTPGPLNIFLFDYIWGGGNYYASHKGAVADLLKRIPTGTQVAVMALADNFTVIQDPTSDLSLLPRALTTVSAPYIVRAEPCTALIIKMDTTLRQLTQAADYLSSIKGRKNLIWLGKPPNELVFPNPCMDFFPAIRLAYDHLAEAETAIDPTDPFGVKAPIATPGGNITANTGDQVAATQMGMQVDIGTNHLAMEGIAEATGGQAFYNNNDINGLVVQAISGGSFYYTLSYAPRIAAYDGKLHSIHVTIRKPGVHLVYRTAYSAEETTPKPADTSSPKQMQAAMAPNAPTATQLLFNVRVQPSTTPPDPFDPPILGQLDPKLKSKPLTRYELLYAVPASQISFAQAADATYTGSLEFDIAAYDIDGRLVTLRSQTIHLPLTNDEYQQFAQTPFQFFQQLDLPPGPLSLRAGVVDNTSHNIGTIQIPVSPIKKSLSTEAGQ